MSALKELGRGLLARIGYQLAPTGMTSDMEAEFSPIHAACRPYAMGTPERLYALYRAVLHLERRGVPGDIVECGVWRGGSSMCCALTLLKHGSTSRTLYMYDTFAGMSEPGEQDKDFRGRSARDIWRARTRGGHTDWCTASESEARENLLSTGYPGDRLVFVAGRVEDTIPAVAPERIALLRLDTDWHESTRHELVHLFPRLSDGGVLLVDDYGYWRGSRDATDGYLASAGARVLLHRIDHAARIGVKESIGA